MMIARVPVSLLLAAVLVSGTAPVVAGDCDLNLSMENWLRSFDAAMPKQQARLERLAACLVGDAEARRRVDFLATEALGAAETLDRDIQRPFVKFNVAVLFLNARAGDPSSQHNYAVVHNAEPGTLVHGIVPQDEQTFVYWTRMAAAQGEPRAVFNLAARMGRPNPPRGIDYDPALAYTLLALLKDTYEEDPTFPKEMMDFIREELMLLAEIIDTSERDDAARALKKFDFALLGPGERE